MVEAVVGAVVAGVDGEDCCETILAHELADEAAAWEAEAVGAGGAGTAGGGAREPVPPRTIFVIVDEA